MINPITNRKILFFGRNIPREKLPKVGNRVFLDCEKNTTQKKLKNAQLLSDCEGAIQKVIFTINSSKFDDVKNIIETFIHKKRASIEVFIFASRGILNKWKKEFDFGKYHNVKLINAKKKISTKWIQDRIMVVEYEEDSTKKTLFLVTNKKDYPFIKELSAELLCKNLSKTKAVLEGGNMLRFGKHLLVGINSVDGVDNERDFCRFNRRISKFETKAHINFIGDTDCIPQKGHLYQLVKENLIPALTPGCQDEFMEHIDMFILPIDAHRVVVGLPKIADIEKAEDDEEIAEICRQRYYMEKLAKQIIAKKIFVDIPFSCEKKIYGYYANSVIENYNGQITAYVPTYARYTPSFEEIENQFLKTLIEAGIHVVKMADFSVLSNDEGALRCMIKVIERN